MRSVNSMAIKIEFMRRLWHKNVCVCRQSLILSLSFRNCVLPLNVLYRIEIGCATYQRKKERKDYTGT